MAASKQPLTLAIGDGVEITLQKETYLFEHKMLVYLPYFAGLSPTTKKIDKEFNQCRVFDLQGLIITAMCGCIPIHYEFTVANMERE